jgi:hypothetical protein
MRARTNFKTGAPESGRYGARLPRVSRQGAEGSWRLLLRELGFKSTLAFGDGGVISLGIDRDSPQCETA